MRGVVSHEVRQLLVRTDTSLHTMYYGIIFLNQLEFTKEDQKLALELVEFYFSLFKKYSALVLEFQKPKKKSRKKEVNSQNDTKTLYLKLISGIITGINRALPYSNGTSS